MKSEQERLAELVGGGRDLEPVDSSSLLEEGLRLKIGHPQASKILQVTDEIRAAGDFAARGSRSSAPQIDSMGGNAEAVMMDMFSLREDLIAAFEGCKINTKTSTRISNAIRISERMISKIGGTVDEFVPLQHVSGLRPPDFLKNAKKVVETTMQCYSLGDISNATISEDGRTINITLNGSEGDTYFKVEGTIVADEWTGSEAIDYIYTPGEGKLSVKVFEDGRWMDKSKGDRYNIVWDLVESRGEPVQEPVPEPVKEPVVAVTKKVTQEKVIPKQSSNKIKDDEEDIGDSIT